MARFTKGCGAIPIGTIKSATHQEGFGFESKRIWWTMGRADLFPRAKAEDRTADGIVFGSKGEMEYWFFLKSEQKAGRIRELRAHTKYTFIVNGVTVGSLKPDYTYINCSDNSVRVVDKKAWRKSPKTGKMSPIVNREWGMKKKLMLACFGLKVEEV
jgi:hypothetical protein